MVNQSQAQAPKLCRSGNSMTKQRKLAGKKNQNYGEVMERETRQEAISLAAK